MMHFSNLLELLPEKELKYNIKKTRENKSSRPNKLYTRIICSSEIHILQKDYLKIINEFPVSEENCIH
jgi:hypothetical protein